MKKKTLIGKVWSGYINEYKKPPVYIIVTPGIDDDTVFVSDLFKKFMMKKVRITIEEIR